MTLTIKLVLFYLSWKYLMFTQKWKVAKSALYYFFAIIVYSQINLMGYNKIYYILNPGDTLTDFASQTPAIINLSNCYVILLVSGDLVFMWA